MTAQSPQEKPETKLLEVSDFEGLVNETFVFSLEGVEEKVEGVLIKAGRLELDRCPGASRDPFVVEFRFPAGSNLGQCVFQVKKPDGERLPPMFLVPRGEDENGYYMNATFN